MSQRRIVELSLEWQILAPVCWMNHEAICAELVDDVVATIDMERFPRNRVRGVTREERGGNADVVNTGKIAPGAFVLGELMQRDQSNFPPMRKPAFCGPAFTVDARFLQKSCELASCVEHPTLDRIARKARDQRDFVDRPFVVVDQIDDFAMHRRQLRETLRKD